VVETTCTQPIAKMLSRGVLLDENLWLHGEFKIKILKYVKRDQRIKSGGPTFLGLNLAKMGLNFEAPAHRFQPGAPNGDKYIDSQRYKQGPMVGHLEAIRGLFDAQNSVA
jgi:hypothetical protein